ncbi:hypothetical protein niasHS_010362 [Heterodera schachtii]|uniref:Uncharacterized protein n=1 Tax=Heterodera schachtii TaxID=97005 RepID=A0ABD2J6Y9_HETSC
MASQAVASQASTYSTPIRIWIEVNGNCQVERRLRHTTVVPLEQMREDIEFHYAGFLGVKEFCGVSINCRHDIMDATKTTTDLLDEHGDCPSLRYVSLSDAFFSTGPDAQNRRDDQIGDRIRLHVPRVTEFLQKNEHVVGALVELLTNQQGWRLTEEQIAQFFLNNPIVAPTSGTDETDGGTTAEPKKDGPTQKTDDDTDEPKEAKKTDEPKEAKKTDEPKEAKKTDEPKEAKKTDEPKEAEETDETNDGALDESPNADDGECHVRRVLRHLLALTFRHGPGPKCDCSFCSSSANFRSPTRRRVREQLADRQAMDEADKAAQQQQKQGHKKPQKPDEHAADDDGMSAELRRLARCHSWLYHPGTKSRPSRTVLHPMQTEGQSDGGQMNGKKQNECLKSAGNLPSSSADEEGRRWSVLMLFRHHSPFLIPMVFFHDEWFVQLDIYRTKCNATHGTTPTAKSADAKVKRIIDTLTEEYREKLTKVLNSARNPMLDMRQLLDDLCLSPATFKPSALETMDSSLRRPSAADFKEPNESAAPSLSPSSAASLNKSPGREFSARHRNGGTNETEGQKMGAEEDDNNGTTPTTMAPSSPYYNSMFNIEDPVWKPIGPLDEHHWPAQFIGTRSGSKSRPAAAATGKKVSSSKAKKGE